MRKKHSDSTMLAVIEEQNSDIIAQNERIIKQNETLIEGQKNLLVSCNIIRYLLCDVTHNQGVLAGTRKGQQIRVSEWFGENPTPPLPQPGVLKKEITS